MADMTLAEVALIVRANTDRLRPDVEKASDGAGRAGGERLGAGITKGIDNELRGGRAKFVAAGKSMGADIGKGFEAEFSGGGAFAKTLATMASRFAIVGGAAGAAAPGVAQFAAALAPAAGAAVVLPAALLAIRAASATVKVAVMGVGEAITAGFGDDPKAAAASLEKLSGEARQFAEEVIALQPEVEGLRKTVSGRFFTPLVGELQPLAEQYLPMLNMRMGDLGGVMGGLGEQILQSAGKAGAFRAVSSLFDNTATAGAQLRAAVDPLVAGFAALIEATAPNLPGMATSFATIATNVGNFVREASESGRVFEAYENGKATLRTLGGIIRNVGSIFDSVLDAASVGSGGLLQNLLELTGQAAAFFRTAQGSGALTSVFGVMADLGDALKTGLAAILPAVAASIQSLAPAISGLAGPAAMLIVALAPLLPYAAGLAAVLIKAVTPALAALAKWLSQNETVMKVAVIAIVAFTAAAKLAGLAAGIQAAGGIATWVKSTIRGSAVGKAFTAVQYAIGVAMKFALGPIGLIITAIGLLVAAVIYAYKNNEGFRKLVDKVWAAVRKFISTAITAVGNVIRNVWQNVISPALSRMNDFIRTVIVPTINWLWKNIVQPAFSAIGRIVQAAWALIRLNLAAWMAFLRNVVFPTIRFLWNNVVTPVFNGLKATISRVWTSGIRPVFKALGDFIKNTVAPAFRLGVTAITKAWEGIRAAARKPVEFVVNQVINPLLNGFNKVAGVFGTPKIEPIKGFADGGQIPGRPSTRDNMLAQGPGGLLKLATGEFVTNTRSTLANLPLIKAINAKRGKVTRRDLDPYLDGREDGGPVGDGIGDFFGKIKNGLSGAAAFIADPKKALAKIANAALGQIPGGGAIKDMLLRMGHKLIGKMGDWLTGEGGAGGVLGGAGGAESWQTKRAIIKRWFPNLQMISGPRPGAVTLSGNRSLHADGLAVDYPPSRALAARIKAVYGRQTQELITPFQDLNLLRGRPHRFTGAVWNQHNFAGGNAHVHWGAKDGGLIDAKSGISQVTAADFGSVTLQRGWNMVHNGLGRPEPLADPTSSSEVAALLRELIAVTAQNPSGFARAMGGATSSMMRQARRQ